MTTRIEQRSSTHHTGLNNSFSGFGRFLHFYTILFMLLFLGFKICAQTDSSEFNFSVQFISDGLPSSEVYSVVQDDYGFIWCSTDRGICRYDGKEFKVFGVAEGLVDPTVFKLINAGGRIWFRCMNGDIGYIKNMEVQIVITYSGKLGGIQEVYSNDSNLIVTYGILDQMSFEEITHKGKVIRKDTLPYAQYIIKNRVDGCFIYGGHIESKPFDFKSMGDITQHFSLQSVVGVHRNVFQTDSFRIFASGHDIIKFSSKEVQRKNFDFSCTSGHLVDNDGNLWVCSYSGLHLFKNADLNQRTDFLQGTATSSILQDHEGNFWISTLDKGIVYLKRTHFNTLEVGRVQQLKKQGEHYVTISNRNLVSVFDNDLNKKQCIKFAFAIKDASISNSKELICVPNVSQLNYATVKGEYTLLKMPGRTILSQSNDTLVSYGKNYLSYITPNYDNLDTLPLSRMNHNRVVSVASNRSVLCRRDGTYELYYPDPDKTEVEQVSDYPLRNFTTNGKFHFGSVKGHGVYVFSTDWQLVDSIQQMNGLASDFVIDLVIQKKQNTLYVGTSKGLSVVSYRGEGAFDVSSTWDTRDGLLSNEINRLLIDSGRLLVGSQAGLQWVSVEHLNQHTPLAPKLVISQVNGRSCLGFQELILPAGTSELELEFYGLRYSDMTQPVLSYQLVDIDPEWEFTRLNKLTYANLGPGDYTFRIKSNNSDIQEFKIKIEATIYETSAFKILVGLILIVLFWMLIDRKNKRIRRQLKGRLENERLRQATLTARLNPHFIFNSLGGLQTLLFKKDIEKATTYIAGFSKLMRHLLKRSGERNTLLFEEMQFLQAFVDLENMKYDLDIRLKWQIEPGLDPGSVSIPSMFIQPLLENSIKHGYFNYKKDGAIILSLKKISSKQVELNLEDFGKGFEESEGHSDHRTHSTELIIKRIKLMQRAYNAKYSMKIVNKADQNPFDSGVKITLILPYVIKQN